jgi:hypothetical protein
MAATAETFDPPPATHRVEPSSSAAAVLQQQQCQQQRLQLPPHVVPPVTQAQLHDFKTQGYLLLPAALDPALCAQARDYMWRVLGAEMPRMRRDEPASWGAFDATELRGGKALAMQPSGFSCYNAQQFHIRCGGEPLFLDLFPRALWAVAEQLFGVGTVAWPGGTTAIDDGLTRSANLRHFTGRGRLPRAPFLPDVQRCLY